MEILTLCFPTEHFCIVLMYFDVNLILSMQNCLMHHTVALKSMKFSCLKMWGESDLVVDSLFLNPV